MSNYIDGINKKSDRYELVSKPISDSIADEFSKTKTYAVGDYVMYEGKLYRCKTAVTTAGNWAQANWELVNIVDDIIAEFKSEVSSTLNDKSSKVIEAFKEYDSGYQTFALYGNFQSYGLDSVGEFLPTQRYRVSNDNRIRFYRDLTVSIKSGFRCGLCSFESQSATTTTWEGWNTSDFVIQANKIFNLQIARVTENTSEIANVDEFVNAITFKTLYSSQAVIPDTVKTAIYELFRNGAFASSDVTDKLEVIREWADGEESLLPSGYTRYDYICNTVNDFDSSTPVTMTTSQLIQLPFTGDKNQFKYECDFSMGNTTRDAALFGGRDNTGGGDDSLAIYVKQGGSMVAFHAHGKDESWFTFSNVPTSGKHHLVFDPRNNPTKLIVDGYEQTRAWYNSSQTLTTKITLFINMVAAGVYSGGLDINQKVGRLKVYSISNTLVGDYVPCKNPNGVAGLYDLVTSSFITSSTNSSRYNCGFWS